MLMAFQTTWMDKRPQVMRVFDHGKEKGLVEECAVGKAAEAHLRRRRKSWYKEHTYKGGGFDDQFAA